MIEQFKLKPEEAKALKDLEGLIGENILLVEKIEWTTFGVKIEGDKVVGVGLYNQGLSTLPESIGNLSSLKILELWSNKLSTLPESIGNLSSLKDLRLGGNKLSTLPESITKLTSLQKLNLQSNQLTTLPESIGNLSSLKDLWLGGNKLSTLPESITNFMSLKKLYLSDNQFTTLPESIGNLTSLQTLNLWNNQLSTLPESIWKCKNLESLNLGDNPWEGEWRGIEKDTTPRVLELSRQRAHITVFITHSRKDEEQYLGNALAQNLENRKEIREVRVSGGQEISEIQLLLFNATKNSI
ncbi:MAG: leucine-rich repeat domain-containing protein, partial [Promethearchaeota archaeon]